MTRATQRRTLELITKAHPFEPGGGRSSPPHAHPETNAAATTLERLILRFAVSVAPGPTKPAPLTPSPPDTGAPVTQPVPLEPPGKGPTVRVVLDMSLRVTAPSTEGTPSRPAVEGAVVRVARPPPREILVTEAWRGAAERPFMPAVSRSSPQPQVRCRVTQRPMARSARHMELNEWPPMLPLRLIEKRRPRIAAAATPVGAGPAPDATQRGRAVRRLAGLPQLSPVKTRLRTGPPPRPGPLDAETPPQPFAPDLARRPGNLHLKPCVLPLEVHLDVLRVTTSKYRQASTPVVHPRPPHGRTLMVPTLMMYNTINAHKGGFISQQLQRVPPRPSRAYPPFCVGQDCSKVASSKFLDIQIVANVVRSYTGHVTVVLPGAGAARTHAGAAIEPATSPSTDAIP